MYVSHLRQTYFDMPIHVFGVLCFNKTYFQIIVKNIGIYIFHVYWIYIHVQHTSSCLNIMFLYLDEFWTKRIFKSKIQVLENTSFGFRQNF